jgi:uncharacterized protein DUF4388/sulfatase-modifying factor enzyme 1
MAGGVWRVAVPIRNSKAEPQGGSDEHKAALVGRIVRGELTPEEACRSEGLSETELKQWVRAYTRAARRAVDDQVAAALAAHGLEVDQLPASEFSGSLDNMGVAELIQTIQYGRKDAQIRIDHAGQQSQLWCIDGDVVDAISAKLSGSPAVYRILSLEHGRVHADFAPVQRARTIHASTQALMLEAAKRSDECRQIRERLGDTLNVYVPSASAPPESEIEPDQADVLRAFDGTRSIEEVVHDSEFPDLETLGLISRLLEQEWLVPKAFGTARREALAKSSPVSALEGSFMPFAASLASRLSIHEPGRRLWASAAAGVAVVSIAFGVGFYSAPHSASDGASAASVDANQPALLPCAPSTAALPGGPCFDLQIVTAGQYQACVRAGACEPAQREFDALPGTSVASASVPTAAYPLGPAPAATAAPVARAPSGAATFASSGAAAPVPSGSFAPTAGAPPAGSTGATPPAAIDAPAVGTLPPALPHGSPAGAAPAPIPHSTAVFAAAPPSSSTPTAAGLDERELTAHCNAGLTTRGDYPINCVTFQQAHRYCEWRAGRLPTRAEWELAATSGIPGVTRLIGSVSEWTFEPAEAGASQEKRERYVMLGQGLDRGNGGPGTLSRRYVNANAQGRSLGFRCVTPHPSE